MTTALFDAKRYGGSRTIRIRTAAAAYALGATGTGVEVRPLGERSLGSEEGDGHPRDHRRGDDRDRSRG